MVKNLPAMCETQVRPLDWEDPLQKEMATDSSTLAWEISRTEKPGGLQSMGSQRVGHDWATDTQALKGNKWQFFLGKIALSKVSNYSYHLKIINIWQSSPWRKKHYKIHKLYKFQTTKNGFTYNIKQTWKSKTNRTTRRKIHYQNGNFKYISRKKCGILKVYTNT